MIKIECNGYKRINKAMARRLFNNGHPVYILPCKVRLDNAWIKPTMIVNNGSFNDSFDTIVNAFHYYNCNYNELGKYASYYIKEAN